MPDYVCIGGLIFWLDRWWTIC